MFSTENRFTIASESELINSFRELDQKKVILPERIKFPLRVFSYFTWKEPSGVYTYLVFKLPNWDLPRSVAFKRTSPQGDPVGGICNWCHAYGSSQEIGLLSIAANAKVSLSYYVCQDLRCAEKIAEASALAGKNPDKPMSELYRRINKLFENLEEDAVP